MEYDEEKYKVIKFPDFLTVHWLINPGLVINELLLGQRVPKVMLADKTSDAPLMERQYVPCNSCNTLNDARLWSHGNAFGHWFGIICPKCHSKIPCLWNLTSLVILCLTFPLWIGIKVWGEKRWLEKEKTRFVNIQAAGLPEAKTTSWLKMGLIYGVVMFGFMELPKIFQGQLTGHDIIIPALIWLLAGLVFGFVMKLYMGRKNKK